MDNLDSPEHEEEKRNRVTAAKNKDPLDIQTRQASAAKRPHGRKLTLSPANISPEDRAANIDDTLCQSIS